MNQELDGNKYFWDSYAIIELEKGNPNYEKYSNEPVFITIFNLAEIYWSILNELNEKEADIIYDKYSEALVEVSEGILKEAMKFRKKYKKANLSYSDCIGYLYSIKNGMKFLTGDKEFRLLENVEFAK